MTRTSPQEKTCAPLGTGERKDETKAVIFIQMEMFFHFKDSMQFALPSREPGSGLEFTHFRCSMREFKT